MSAMFFIASHSTVSSHLTNAVFPVRRSVSLSMTNRAAFAALAPEAAFCYNPSHPRGTPPRTPPRRLAAMPPIETIARPRRNRISIPVPKEYGSYSFQVILVPLVPNVPPPPSSPAGRRKKNFVEALLSCPKLADGETLDVSRNETDFGREVAL